jgi:hypothetical protein
MNRKITHRISQMLTAALLLPCCAAIAQQNTTQVQTVTSPAASMPEAVVKLPAPFKVVGGGARTNWSGDGNLLTQTQPGAPGQNTWMGSGKDHLVASPATLTVYGIGLADPNDDWEVGVFHQTSGVAAHPVATASLPAGYALTGGGCLVDWRASPSAMGNLLTASFPSSLTTWECRSKDHSVSSPAPITAFVVGIRPKKAGIALPTVQITTATSAATNHPTAVAPGLPGWGKVPGSPGWVVTGGGARAMPVHRAGQAQPQAGAGQLLTGSFPTTSKDSRAPTGWYAASKDHAVASPGIVQAFAINLYFNRP